MIKLIDIKTKNCFKFFPYKYTYKKSKAIYSDFNWLSCKFYFNTEIISWYQEFEININDFKNLKDFFMKKIHSYHTLENSLSLYWININTINLEFIPDCEGHIYQFQIKDKIINKNIVAIEKIIKKYPGRYNNCLLKI